MIVLQSATKQFQHRGKAVTALASVSLEIAKGDFVAVIGPSGSGKSTLLHLLGGMLSLTEGKVRFGNDSMYDLTSDERSAIRKNKIGFVFQTFNLVPYLTALENVQVPLVLAGLGEEGQQRRAEMLLKRVGLSDRLDHKPRELSVGEQQRVSLARMLANDPQCIPRLSVDWAGLPARRMAKRGRDDELDGAGPLRAARRFSLAAGVAGRAATG